GGGAVCLGVATPKSLSCPPFGSASETPRLSNMRSTLPAARSVSAGAEPRYGTCWNLTPAIIWNISAVRGEVGPVPWVAQVSLPGVALAWAVTSATLGRGALALTTSAFGTRPMMTMGTNSVGSNPSLG